MSDSSADRFIVFNDDGGIVPADAYEVLRAVVDGGHRVYLDVDNDVVLERGPGRPAIAADQIATLRRWRHHVRMLVMFYSQTTPSTCGRWL